MIVFKNYFKILKAHKKILLFYTIVFLAISIMAHGHQKQANNYVTVKAKMYLEDRSGTPLSKALCDRLAEKNEIIEMKADIVEDKLFYQMISLAVEIPENFKENRIVKIRQAPNDIYAQYVKEDINKYLSFIDKYENMGFTEEEAIKLTEENLREKVDVSLNKQAESGSVKGANLYFNFLAYILMSQIILAVSNIVLSFKKETVYKRNLISPISIKRQRAEMVFGHLISGLTIWFIYMILYALMWGGNLFSKQISLMMLNSLIFTMTTVSLAAFISDIISDENSMAGVVNVVTLGSCFLSGVFVPQELLGQTALKIGRLFPTYYYVANNNILENSTDFKIISKNILIMLLYSFAFIVISLIRGAKKKEA